MQLILAYDSEYQRRKVLPILAWCLLDDAGHLQLSGLETSLADIVEATKLYIFSVHIFLVNPDAIVLTTPRPAGSFSKIRQALPYLLEDQLAEDVEDLHFAILSQAAPQTLVVGIISRSLMQQCSQEFRAAGLIPQTLLPLWMVLPQAQENEWLALTDSHYIWIRTGKFSGLACERAQVTPLLSVLLARQKPQAINWVSAQSIEPEWESECTAHQVAVSVSQLPSAERWITFVAKNFVPEPGMNLLQGEFTVKQRTVSEKRWWHIAKILAASVVVVWFIGLVGQYFYLGFEDNKLKQQIENVYHEVYPGQAVKSPRTIFERELNNASKGKGSNDFLSLLLRVGEVTSSTQQVQLTSLTYDNNELALSLTVDNFSRLQQIDKKLQEQGLTVEQENATSSGGIVQARWRIK